METFFVNCVMSNWLTITLLELCVIIFNTGMYALAWRLAKAKCQSCHTVPVAQMVEHGASNAKIMGLIPRESKS